MQIVFINQPASEPHPQSELQNQTNVCTFGTPTQSENKHTLPNNHRTLLYSLCCNRFVEGVSTTLNRQKHIRLCLAEVWFA